MCTAAERHRNASLSQARNAPAGLFRPIARRSTEPLLREGKVNHSCPLGKVCPQAIHLQSTRKAAERRPEPHRRQAGSAARHPHEAGRPPRHSIQSHSSNCITPISPKRFNFPHIPLSYREKCVLLHGLSINVQLLYTLHIE